MYLYILCMESISDDDTPSGDKNTISFLDDVVASVLLYMSCTMRYF